MESFCYDEENSCFYILNVSILSISILVCDSFEKSFNKEKNELEKLFNTKVSDILMSSFETFLNKYLDKIHLFINCYKQDLPWYYSNWNFYYSSLCVNFMMNEERSKYSYGEYPHKLFHKKKGDSNASDILNEKLKESTDYNQNFIFEKIKILSDRKIVLNTDSLINEFDSP